MNTLLERAASIREAEIRTAQVDLAEWRRRYVEILSRQDAPKPEDAQALLDTATELRLSNVQVEEDCRTVARYVRLQEQAAQYESLHAVEVSLRENLKCIRRESERAIQIADAEQTKAGNHASFSLNARAQLDQLRRERSDLFPVTG